MAVSHTVHKFDRLITIHLYIPCRAVVAVAAYEELDIATTILTFFLVNALFFLAAYVITKVCITCAYIHVVLLQKSKTTREVAPSFTSP